MTLIDQALIDNTVTAIEMGCSLYEPFQSVRGAISLLPEECRAKTWQVFMDAVLQALPADIYESAFITGYSRTKDPLYLKMSFTESIACQIKPTVPEIDYVYDTKMDYLEMMAIKGAAPAELESKLPSIATNLSLSEETRSRALKLWASLMDEIEKTDPFHAFKVAKMYVEYAKETKSPFLTLALEIQTRLQRVAERTGFDFA